MAKFETLIDDFNSGSLDTVKWDGSYGGVTVSVGQAIVPVTTGYPALASNTYYDLTESYFYGKIVAPTQPGNGSKEFFVELIAANGDLMRFFMSGENVLVMNLRIAGVNTNTTIPYSPVDHAWLRFTEWAGVLYWDASPNGVTWTNLRTDSAGALATTELRPNITSGYWGTEDADNVLIDSINVEPTTVVSATAATTWAVRSRTTKTVLTRYAVRAIVTGTKITRYNVLTSIAKTVPTSWAVTTPITDPHATTWGVRAITTKTSATDWTTNSIVENTASTSWDILTSVASTKSTAWSARTAVQKTVATLWAAKTRVAKTSATSWSEALRIESTDSTSWDVQSNIVSTVTTGWTVSSSIERQISTEWGIEGPLQAGFPTDWDVLNTSPVVTFNTGWGVFRPVQVTKVTSWTDRAQISLTRPTSWSIGEGVSEEFNTDWGVLIGLEVQQGTGWAVQRSIVKSAPTYWEVHPTTEVMEYVLYLPEYNDTLRISGIINSMGMPDFSGQLIVQETT